MGWAKVYCSHNKRAFAKNKEKKTRHGYKIYTIYTRARTPLLDFWLDRNGHVITASVWDTNHVQYGVHFYGRKGGPLEKFQFIGTIYREDMRKLTGQWHAQWKRCACGLDCFRPLSMKPLEEHLPRVIPTRRHLRGRIAGVGDYLERVAQWLLL